VIAFRNLKISCPECGNNREFVEIADDVILTTRYVQNEDGSFKQEVDESQILGDVQFLCGICGADLTQYHQRFQEMLF
jgi:DNA-directed RNA polymerase subunit M/transcription elongation factor TFIIS